MTDSFEFVVNGRPVVVDTPTYMPVLWVPRDLLGLIGTKFVCGIAPCGACTVHLDSRAVRYCVLAMSAVKDRAITTIEAIGQSPTGQRVQQPWLEAEVLQCRRCQSGQVMSAVAPLKHVPRPRSGRRATYGDMTLAASRKPTPQNVSLKELKDFRLLGKPWCRLDYAMKVDGTIDFGIDACIPDMRIILRFPDVPNSIEIHIINRPGMPFIGSAEAAQGPTVAAFANALADAIGTRLRELPLSPERVNTAVGAM